LKSWFNPEVPKVKERLISGRETILECANVTIFLVDNSGELTKFHEAYNHPESDL
jgi:chromosome condensin MukBEF MukE localization factor